MKIRNGFVSNSSSSSFILIGVKLSSKSLLNIPSIKEKLIEAVQETQIKFNEEWTEKMNSSEFEKHKEVWETCNKNGISIPNETRCFFGWSFKGKYEPLKVNANDLLHNMIGCNEIRFPKGIDILHDDDISYVGKIIFDGEDLPDNSKSLEDINKIADELVEFGFDKNEIMLYSGTRAC